MYALGGTLETELKVLRSELQRLRAKDAGADADDVEELEEEIEELQSALEYAAKLPSTSKQGSKAISRPTRAVDLCAAPGSWSQVLVQRLPTGPHTRIVSVDLQPMAPIAGVHQILGDITTQATAHAVANALAGENNADEARAQLIVCDGAPDVTGIHDVDEYLQAQLLLSALQITMRLLEAGGTFIAKIFCQKHSVSKSTSTLPNQRGDTSALLVEQMKQLFELVDVAKPRSSRIASHEHFIGECDCESRLKDRRFLEQGNQILTFCIRSRNLRFRPFFRFTSMPQLPPTTTTSHPRSALHSSTRPRGPVPQGPATAQGERSRCEAR